MPENKIKLILLDLGFFFFLLNLIHSVYLRRLNFVYSYILVLNMTMSSLFCFLFNGIEFATDVVVWDVTIGDLPVGDVE